MSGMQRESPSWDLFGYSEEAYCHLNGYDVHQAKRMSLLRKQLHSGADSMGTEPRWY